jgi:hypothetical protein
MTRHGFAWSLAALLGIVCAAAIAWSASLLAGQHIGLSSVPLSAVGRLAPAAARAQPHAHTPHVHHQPQAPRPTASAHPQQRASLTTVTALNPVPPSAGAPAPAAAASQPPTASAPATTATPVTPARPRDDSSHAGAGSSQPHSGSSDKRDD